MSETFIYYGNDYVDIDKISAIKNEEFMWCKPLGGLWASPVNAKFSWRDWCNNENFTLASFEKYTTFQIKDDAKYLYLRNKEDLLNIPEKYILRWTYRDGIVPSLLCLDFEKLCKDGYQVIYYLNTYYTHYALNAWDCDSILVMDPDIIINMKNGVTFDEDT